MERARVEIKKVGGREIERETGRKEGGGGDT